MSEILSWSDCVALAAISLIVNPQTTGRRGQTLRCLQMTLDNFRQIPPGRSRVCLTCSVSDYDQSQKLSIFFIISLAHCIMAAILASLHRRTADDLFGLRSLPSPPHFPDPLGLRMQRAL